MKEAVSRQHRQELQSTAAPILQTLSNRTNKKMQRFIIVALLATCMLFTADARQLAQDALSNSNGCLQAAANHPQV